MASPQIEHGHTRIANELLEVFGKMNLSAYEWRLIMVILRKTYGWNRKSDIISLSQLSEATGLRKPHVSRTKKSLLQKKILHNGQGKLGINKDWETWAVTNSGGSPNSGNEITNSGNESRVLGQKRRIVTSRGGSPNSGNEITNSGNKSLPIQGPTKESKDTYTKERAEQTKKKQSHLFKPPTAEQVSEYAKSIDYPTLNASQFVDFYEARGWVVGTAKMKSWEAAVRTWKHRDNGTAAAAAPKRRTLCVDAEGLTPYERWHKDRDLPIPEHRRRK